MGAKLKLKQRTVYVTWVAIAKCVFPAIVEFFASEEGQREFAEWKAQLVEKSA